MYLVAPHGNGEDPKSGVISNVSHLLLARCTDNLQDGPKMAPKWLEDGCKMAPKWLQDGPKMAQRGHTMPPMAPRVPQWPPTAPRWLQGGPKLIPKGPKMAPRWPQDGPMMALRGPKMSPFFFLSTPRKQVAESAKESVQLFEFEGSKTTWDCTEANACSQGNYINTAHASAL